MTKMGNQAARDLGDVLADPLPEIKVSSGIANARKPRQIDKAGQKKVERAKEEKLGDRVRNRQKPPFLPG